MPYGATFLPQNQDPTLAASAMPGATALLSQFLRPYRGIGDINLYESAATGNYNSLQVTVNRRVGQLFLGLSYTWSKNLTTASGDTNFVRADQYTRQAYYGPSGNDRRHKFALNYVYNLPTLAGKNGFEKAVLGGWQISGVTSFISGSPYSTELQRLLRRKQPEHHRVVLPRVRALRLLAIRRPASPTRITGSMHPRMLCRWWAASAWNPVSTT